MGGVNLSARAQEFVARYPVGLIGLMVWVATLGIQLQSPIANFRFSPGDALLLVLLVLTAVLSWHSFASALRPTRVNALLVALALALLVGAIVGLMRTGVLTREAWLNKGVGVFILAAIVVVVRSTVRTTRDVEWILAALLISGTVLEWSAAISRVATASVTGTLPEVRFSGLLLNPSANAVFVAVLLVVQMSFLLKGGRRSIQWMQRANGIGLAFLLLSTLSRSTWLAALIALAVIWMVTRGRQIAQFVALAVVLTIAFEPLQTAIAPIIGQVASGRGIATTRETSAISDQPPGAIAALLSGRSWPVVPPSEWRIVTSTATECGQAIATPRPVEATAPPLPPRAADENPVVLGLAAIGKYLLAAGQSAADRHGGTDRLALDAIGIRIWLATPSTAITGIGLGTFCQISPYTSFGIPLIIHSTYVWLPVEVGFLGLLVVALLLFACTGLIRRLVALPTEQRHLGLALAGALVLFATWIGMNEGLYQRAFWLVLATGSSLVAANGASKGREAHVELTQRPS